MPCSALQLRLLLAGQRERADVTWAQVQRMGVPELLFDAAPRSQSSLVQVLWREALVVPTTYQSRRGHHGRLYAPARSLPLASGHALRPLNRERALVRGTLGLCVVWIGSLRTAITPDYEEPELPGLVSCILHFNIGCGAQEQPQHRGNDSTPPRLPASEVKEMEDRQLDGGHRAGMDGGVGGSNGIFINHQAREGPRFPKTLLGWIAQGIARRLAASWWVNVPSAQWYFWPDQSRFRNFF